MANSKVLLLTSLSIFIGLYSCSDKNKYKAKQVTISSKGYLNDTAVLLIALDSIMPSGENIHKIGASGFKNKYLSLVIKNYSNDTIYLMRKGFVHFPIDTMLTLSIKVVAAYDMNNNIVWTDTLSNYKTEDYYEKHVDTVLPNLQKERVIYFPQKQKISKVLCVLNFLQQHEGELVLKSDSIFVSSTYSVK